MRRSVSIFRVLTCAVLVLAALPTTLSRADVSASGDFVPGTISDAGGDLGALLIIGDTGVAGLFMDAAPPLFGTLTPLRAVDGIIGNDTESIGAITLEDFLGGDLVLTNSFIVGNAGQGFLDLFDSASVTVTNLMTIGSLQEGLGVATINGQGSRVIAGDLIVADLGVGNLELNARATVRSENGYIGNGDGSVGTVLVTGVGTRWAVGSELPNIEGRLVVGNLIADGDIGEVNNDAQFGRGQGTLRIVDRGLVQVSDELIIGPSGRLELETQGRLRILPTSEDVSGTNFDVLDAITNQGVILGDGYVDFVGVTDGPANSQSSRALVFLNTPSGEIRNAANASGTLGGTNQREKLVFNGNAANLDTLINNGTIESLGGEMEFNVPVVNNFEIVARDAVMRFPQVLFNNGPDGILVLGGDTTVHGIVDNTGGGSVEVLPGSDVAVIGDLRFSTASIVSLVIGDDASNLFISGVTDLGNAILELNYSNGDAPQAGDTYEILASAGGLGGTTFINTPVPAGGALWDITYVGDSVFASFGGIAAGPSGADFNGDGIVNQLDIIIWQDNYGRTSPPNLDALGDADSDGDVDGRDFLRIQREFGGPGVEPIVANLASVPEPSALVLLLSAAVGLVARRKR